MCRKVFFNRLTVEGFTSSNAANVRVFDNRFSVAGARLARILTLIRFVRPNFFPDNCFLLGLISVSLALHIYTNFN